MFVLDEINTLIGITKSYLFNFSHLLLFEFLRVGNNLFIVNEKGQSYLVIVYNDNNTNQNEFIQLFHNSRLIRRIEQGKIRDLTRN